MSGTNDYAHAGLCLNNTMLQNTIYEGVKEQSGIAGYQNFISWIKAQLIAGNYVSIGVLIKTSGGDSQYDHEVTVVKIGTNHSVTDATYYPDDVLYFEDHGAFTVSTSKTHKVLTTTPDIPPGAGDTATCTPYIFGYKVSDLAATRSQANTASRVYSIIIPGASVVTQQGTDGYKSTTSVISRNWGFASSGVIDTHKVTFPVSITIVSSTTNGVANPKDSFAGYNYENPMVCHGMTNYLSGYACCNNQPAAMSIGIQATVSGLTIGATYNLYEYDFNGIKGVGSMAKLAVPKDNFNAQAALATVKTTFTATASTYSRTVTRLSSQIVVFRCVLTTSP